MYSAEGRFCRLTFLYETPETERTYVFPGGDVVTVKGVKEARATAHGFHHLTLDDGSVRIVPSGWIELKLPDKGPTPEQFKRGGGAWGDFGRKPTP